MTKIKVCGITRYEDAMLACELGYDAIGFVFYKKSKRYIELNQLNWLHKVSAFIQTVALFVDETEENIHTICNEIPIDLLQFHGQESDHFCTQFNKRYLKSVPMQKLNQIQAQSYCNQYLNASGFLFDNYGKTTQGGSGHRFNWQDTPDIPKHQLIIAGGLTSENVQQVIQKLSPFAVDVSSGVEESYGIKSKEKMISFIKAVKQN